MELLTTAGIDRGWIGVTSCDNECTACPVVDVANVVCMVRRVIAGGPSACRVGNGARRLLCSLGDEQCVLLLATAAVDRACGQASTQRWCRARARPRSNDHARAQIRQVERSRAIACAVCGSDGRKQLRVGRSQQRSSVAEHPISRNCCPSVRLDYADLIRVVHRANRTIGTLGCHQYPEPECATWLGATG